MEESNKDQLDDVGLFYEEEEQVEDVEQDEETNEDQADEEETATITEADVDEEQNVKKAPTSRRYNVLKVVFVDEEQVEEVVRTFDRVKNNRDEDWWQAEKMKNQRKRKQVEDKTYTKAVEAKGKKCCVDIKAPPAAQAPAAATEAHSESSNFDYSLLDSSVEELGEETKELNVGEEAVTKEAREVVSGEETWGRTDHLPSSSPCH